MPASLLSQYSPANGASVPLRRQTRYCSSLSCRRHSSSVLSIVSVIPIFSPRYRSRQRRHHRLGGGETRLRILAGHQIGVDPHIHLPIGGGPPLGAEFAQTAIQQKGYDPV